MSRRHGFTLSPASVPSGNVTFVMNNTGTVTHNFDVGGVKAGAFVDPGKSATIRHVFFDIPGHGLSDGIVRGQRWRDVGRADWWPLRLR
jgi:hypothetical protein